MLSVENIPAMVVYQYAEQNKDDHAPEYEQTVLNIPTLKCGLEAGYYARQRSCFGLFMETGEMLGYCVLDEGRKSLDFLHIKKEVRGLGLGKWFLGNFDIKSVYVEPENQIAKALYTKLGYELEGVE